MDNEGTSSYILRSEQQTRADQQREYRQKQRTAFDNLFAVLEEVELINRCPRREVPRHEVLKKAAECLQSLRDEQVNLQQQLWELSGNLGGENILPEVNLQPWLGELTGNMEGVNIPQSRELTLDQDLELYEFFAQLEFDGQGMTARGPSYRGWP